MMFDEQLGKKTLKTNLMVASIYVLFSIINSIFFSIFDSVIRYWLLHYINIMF